MRISGMRWSLLAVVVISLALVTSGCLKKNKHYTTYSGVDPGMSLAQAKDYCGAIASSAKSGAKSAFQQAQNKKKKKRYWSDGMFVYEQEVSGGFAGGFAEGLSKGLKGNAAYSRVMKGCMAEQGYKLTSKTTSTYKPKPEKTTTARKFSVRIGKSIYKVDKSQIIYCQSDVGGTDKAYEGYGTDCGGKFAERITKSEYKRFKKINSVLYCSVIYEHSSGADICPTRAVYKQLAEQGYKLTTKSSTASNSKTTADSIKAKLKELKDLLDEGLITKEEAAAKRAKLLEDL